MGEAQSSNPGDLAAHCKPLPHELLLVLLLRNYTSKKNKKESGEIDSSDIDAVLIFAQICLVKVHKLIRPPPS
jgi:hypothetical protein